LLLITLVRLWYLIGYGREITGARQHCIVSIVKMDIMPPTAMQYLRSFSELTEINLYIYRQNILIYMHEKWNDLHNPRWTLIRITNLPEKCADVTTYSNWSVAVAPNCPFSLCLDPAYIGSRNSHSCYDKITIFWDVIGQGFCFKRNVRHASTFRPWNGHNGFVRNVNKYLPEYTASHLSRKQDAVLRSFHSSKIILIVFLKLGP